MSYSAGLHNGTRVLGAGLGIAVLAVAGCGGSSSSKSKDKAPDPNAAEVSPAGDIPDNQAFVAYSPPGAGYSVKVPEGWARTSSGGAVTFTDKLNSIRLESSAAGALSPGQARAEAQRVAGRAKGFKVVSAATVKRTAGTGTRVVYLVAGKPDPVTGKAKVESVERYTFAKGGRRATLSLTGPKGADNVDPWRIVTDSLRWTG